MYIVEMNIFVSPLEVMNDSFISEFLLDNEDILEKIDDPLLYIEMIEFGYHRLLIL